MITQTPVRTVSLPWKYMGDQFPPPTPSRFIFHHSWRQLLTSGSVTFFIFPQSEAWLKVRIQRWSWVLETSNRCRQGQGGRSSSLDGKIEHVVGSLKQIKFCKPINPPLSPQSLPNCFVSGRRLGPNVNGFRESLCIKCTTPVKVGVSDPGRKSFCTYYVVRPNLQGVDRIVKVGKINWLRSEEIIYKV